MSGVTQRTPPAAATMPPVPGHTGNSLVPRGRQSQTAPEQESEK